MVGLVCHVMSHPLKTDKNDETGKAPSKTRHGGAHARRATGSGFGTMMALFFQAGRRRKGEEEEEGRGWRGTNTLGFLHLF